MPIIRVTNLYPGDLLSVNNKDTRELIFDKRIPPGGGTVSFDVHVPLYIHACIRVKSLDIKDFEAVVPITEDLIHTIHIVRIPNYLYSPNHPERDLSGSTCPEMLALEKQLKDV